MNSPSLSYVILLHHQLLTASAHLAIAVECSAMQGYAKQRSYIFVYTWPSINGCGLSACETSWLTRASFPFRTKVASVALRTSRAIEQLAYSAQTQKAV